MTWPASSSMVGPDYLQLPLVDIKPMTYTQVFLFVYHPAREVSNYPSSPVPKLLSGAHESQWPAQEQSQTARRGCDNMA